MTFVLTPAQYATLKTKLLGQKDVTVKPAGDLSGLIITPDVTLSYSYDGTKSLAMQVTEKHSFRARHIATAAMIESKIKDLIMENL